LVLPLRIQDEKLVQAVPEHSGYMQQLSELELVDEVDLEDVLLESIELLEEVEGKGEQDKVI